MNLRTVLSAFAVLIVLGGLAALLVPGTMMHFYGVGTPDAVAVVLLRAVGAMGIGVGLMAWSARGADDSAARNALVPGLTVFNGLSAIALLLGALSGLFNAFAWVPVAAYAIFTVLFLAAGRARMASNA